jgi:hypothetical protein
MRKDWNPNKLKELEYIINDRTLKEVIPFLEKFPRLFPQKVLTRENELIYSGAEHRGNPKLPNVTFIPNLPIVGGSLLGSTFGHQHTQRQTGDTRPFQEIYEFQSYGAMLLRSEKSTRLITLKPGEKVIVGTDENMTLFNLDECPLLTLDYANPEMNSATKDLEKRIGPPIAILRTKEEIYFYINPQYNREGLIKGKRNSVVIRSPEMGKNLIKSMESQNEEFYQCGIELANEDNIPRELKQEFVNTLSKLVNEKNKKLLDILRMNT